MPPLPPPPSPLPPPQREATFCFLVLLDSDPVPACYWGRKMPCQHTHWKKFGITQEGRIPEGTAFEELKKDGRKCHP